MRQLEGRIEFLEHESRVLRSNPLGDPYRRRLPIYLPAGYDTNPSCRYPVIWVMAPYSSWGERFFNLQPWDENIVQIIDRLLSEGRASPAIMAFPDCFTRYGGSQYVNSTAVGRYEDYLIRELVPFLDRAARTLPAREHRAVMGYSSGGYGAYRLAMRHADRFGALASHSGDLFFEQCYLPDIPATIRALDKHGGVDNFLKNFPPTRERSRDWSVALGLIAMSACYSPNPGSPTGFDLPFDPTTGEVRPDVWRRWLRFDPTRMARHYLSTLRSLKLIYFDCGIRDEYNLFLGARVLHRILEQSEIPHRFEEFDGGHQRIEWRYEISLPLVTAAIQPV